MKHSIITLREIIIIRKMCELRLLTLVLSTAILLSMSVSCINESIDVELPEYVYVPRVVPLPYDIEWVEHLSYSDGKVYFVTTNIELKHRNRYMADHTVEIYSMNIDGTELTRLDSYTPAVDKPDDVDGWSLIRGMTIDNNGFIWVVENWRFCKYDFPEDYNHDGYNAIDYWHFETEVTSGTAVRKLDTTGAELLYVDLSYSPNVDGVFYCNGFIEGKDAGNQSILYLGIGDISGGTVIYALDSIGDILFSFSIDSKLYEDSRFVQMPDGSVAIPVPPDYNPEPGYSGCALQVIDAVTGSLGDVIKLPKLEPNCLAPGESGMHFYPPNGFRRYSGSGHIFSGNGVFDFIIDSNIGVFAYNIGDDVAIPLLNWRENHITLPGSYHRPKSELVMTPDGHIVCIDERFNSSFAKELLILLRTPRSEMAEKITLTLATLGVSEDLKYAVMEFNRINNNYSIEIIDYLEFSIEYDYRNDAIMQLAADITVGKVPDIICGNGLPYVDLTKAGLFADLYKFIDADPDFERTDFVQAAFHASEIDGGLYRVFSEFGISTLFVRDSSVAGSKIGWNMEDFAIALEGLTAEDFYNSGGADGFLYKTRLLEMGLRCSIDEYVDTKTKTVSFDTESFIHLLELINRYPGATAFDDIDYSSIIRVNPDTPIMFGNTILDFHVFKRSSSIFGEDVTIKGWPTQSRNGHYLIPNGSVISISENSEHKETSWEFVKIFLDGARQLDMRDPFTGGFPTNQTAFNRMQNDSIEKAYTVFFPVEKTTQDEVDMVLSLIDAASEASAHSIYFSEGLWDIIREEALDYFNGERSAEYTAHIIQSRASMFIAERK